MFKIRSISGKIASAHNVRGRPRLLTPSNNPRGLRFTSPGPKRTNLSGCVGSRRNMCPRRLNYFLAMSDANVGAPEKRKMSSFETRPWKAAYMPKMRLRFRMCMYSRWAKSPGSSGMSMASPRSLTMELVLVRISGP